MPLIIWSVVMVKEHPLKSPTHWAPWKSVSRGANRSTIWDQRPRALLHNNSSYCSTSVPVVLTDVNILSQSRRRKEGAISDDNRDDIREW
jgi:hypothetical protein